MTIIAKLYIALLLLAIMAPSIVRTKVRTVRWVKYRLFGMIPQSVKERYGDNITTLKFRPI